MQFKYPELLYALFLLVIPIIVHLFQLRKFKKVPFTNVAFLKNVAIQTRKSSQLKKWLTLITRLLLFAAIIFAFTQPYFSKNNTLNKKTETVIFLDNSFSMQAKGEKGVLLKRALQDIIANTPENENISILTNSQTFKNTTLSAIKNSMLQLDYASNSMLYKTALLKSKNLFSKEANTLKNLIYISDFQQKKDLFNPENDSAVNYYAVKLNPVSTQNTAIDSAYISNSNPTKLELSVVLKNSGNPIENLPVSLLNNNNLIAKTSTKIEDKATVSFDLPANEIINGTLTINDTHLQFDNTLYFNINASDKINVLAISSVDTDFLKRIYTNDEFQFSSYTLNTLDYNRINDQDLIILNELETIPNALSTVLKSFTSNGGTVLIIPSNNTIITSYNTLLSNYRLGFQAKISNEKRVTTINYSHPLYNNGVFEKRITNFQYPKVNSFFNLSSKAFTSILSFEDNKPFLTGNANLYLFTAALSSTNSNFKSSPLIVPTLYNIAKNSYKVPNLYYNIGASNSFEVKTNLQQDGVLTLKHERENIIPKQQVFNNKVIVTTGDIPVNAGIFNVMNGETPIKNVSYNFNRDESDLTYQNLDNLTGITVSNSVAELFSTLKSEGKVNALWKWFVIFALILLLTEMLILKYFK
ncbi:N-terminal double-transmembrane domain-containing protein [Hyunsoonleella jejuensis]|uniref:N-terminal double-transmembrane domain-containing protein n=1 Tax=Hyunsoonleella jejuensis TaxID=419940 RepID=A0A1H9KF01_9FLAO|nr:BatA domain-containing protein [Hyunsoonleella jejuensis]SEQ97692.1 N-terminal double-transmembrane domain-containing protein [Hyunsoonleella jejuensis]